MLSFSSTYCFAEDEPFILPAFTNESSVVAFLDRWSENDIAPNDKLLAFFDDISSRCTQRKWTSCLFKSNLLKIESLINLERLAEAHELLPFTQKLLPKNADLAEQARVNIVSLDILTHKGSREEVEQLIATLESQAQAILATEGNKGAGRLYVAIGRNQSINYQFADAIKSLQKAYVEFDRVNDLDSTGNALVSLGNVYTAIDNVDKALEYFDLALMTNRQLNNEFNESIVLFNIGQAYLNKKDYLKSRSYFSEALSLSETLEDTIGIMWTKLMLGHVALEAGEYHKALALFKETEPVFIEVQESSLLYSALFGSAKAKLGLGDVEAAAAIMQKTSALFETMNAPPKKVDRLLVESKIQHLQGKYELAYTTLQAAMDLQLEIKKHEKASLVERYQVEFDTKLKEQQNQALLEQNNEQLRKLAQQEHERLLWVIAILAIVLCAAVLGAFLAHQTRLRRRFKSMAMKDPLTSQPNRRSVLRFAQSAFKQALESKNAIGIAIIDLDFFKKINDEFGHDTGDNVLKAFGEACKDTIRQQDGFGRYGGEEWLLVLRDVNEKQIEAIFHRLSEQINSVDIEGFPSDRRITFSMGAVSQKPSNELSLQKIIQAADELLYTAKEQGRNRVVSEVIA